MTEYITCLYPLIYKLQAPLFSHFSLNFTFQRNFQFKVWDTGGQERYRPVLTTCYRNAHGIIIVYDVTNEKSFTNLNQWMTEVAEFAKPDLPKMLVIFSLVVCFFSYFYHLRI